MALYATAFEKAGKLDRLEGFASHFGPDFYNLPRNQDTITLVRQPYTIPAELSYKNGETLVPLAAGERLEWQLAE